MATKKRNLEEKIEMGEKFWDMDLESKPDFVDCMKRVYAWYDQEVLDRVPVRFSAHNEEYDGAPEAGRWNSEEERWFDTEYRVNSFEKFVQKNQFLGETFPVFFPDLGPNYYGATLGGELDFGEVTSWMRACTQGERDLDRIYFREDGKYYKKMMELTDCALSRCKNQFIVGYTDMHPGMDCAAAFRGTEALCMDLYDNEDFVEALVAKCEADFGRQMEEFHRKLAANGQVSVTWMNIPSYEGMHIPSCDFSALISSEFFERFELPCIKQELNIMKHNIFHVDGPGVARHLDMLLPLDDIQAYQWVQGPGSLHPIMQWVPLIKKIQQAGKSVVVDLQPSELEDFIACMDPHGIYLCVNEKDTEAQQQILKRLLKWK